MLEANKSIWFEKIFAVYNLNLLKRYFFTIKIDGLETLRNDVPSIIYANHSGWWDGLLAFQISQAMAADSYFMMEEKHLKKYFLFRKLGAFSVVRENPRKAIESLNYAAELLKINRKRTLWIFPQGEILPNDHRPIKFYNGLSRIIEKSDGAAATVTCLAMRYEFLNEYKPEIYVKVGTPARFRPNSNFNAKELSRTFEENLTATLDQLKLDLAAKNTSRYEKIF